MPLDNVNLCHINSNSSPPQCQYVQDMPVGKNASGIPRILHEGLLPCMWKGLLEGKYGSHTDFLQVSGLQTCTANFYFSGTDNPAVFSMIYGFHNPSGIDYTGTEFADAILKDQGVRTNSHVLIYVPIEMDETGLSKYGYESALKKFISFLLKVGIPNINITIIYGIQHPSIYVNNFGEFGLMKARADINYAVYQPKVDCGAGVALEQLLTQPLISITALQVFFNRYKGFFASEITPLQRGVYEKIKYRIDRAIERVQKQNSTTLPPQTCSELRRFLLSISLNAPPQKGCTIL